MNQPLWRPDSRTIKNTNMSQFMQLAAERWERQFPDYAALHKWSVDEPDQLWKSIWSFCEVIAARRGETVVENPELMPGANWFPDAKLNFAENLLRRRDDGPALIFRAEEQEERWVSFAELYDEVSRLAQALSAVGVKSGDRVVGIVPNLPEAIMAMLATASLGGVWSSCSPDFGVQGVLDRFGQIEPTVVFCADAYYYNGKTHDCLPKLGEIVAALPTVEKVILIPYVHEEEDLIDVPGIELWSNFVAEYQATDIEFTQLDFAHPLYVMFSSGTTGVPKCIVHGAGGTLLQHLKEHRLHCDLQAGDRLFYFTTCGWMMWNWLVTGLASGATLMLYDGSPFYPNGNVLFDFAETERINIFGTSAKFIDAVNKAEIKPIETHDLSAVRLIMSTGSPLVAESFDYVYSQVKQDVCLSSISGGTDIIACFIGGNPNLPVWQGEMQSATLGLQIEVMSPDGEVLGVGEKGELVCMNAFPSMPIGFWGDHDNAKYHAAYFEKFPNVWCHGDFVERTEHDGYIIYGRSDATLNPGGVRIGTAEIYRQAEQIEAVVESLVIGQQWEGDTRVVLFVRLRDGVDLDDTLISKIKTQIRQNTTPRHVPAKVVQVADIPRTKSGKIVELAVRQIVHGEAVKNKEALANPQALDLFAQLPELQT